MEYILVILLLFLICGAIIKFIKRTATFIISFIIPLFLYLFFNVPYFWGVIICSIIKFAIIDILSNLKEFSKRLFLNNNKFLCKFLGKSVYILLNINYFLFMLICYYNIIVKCLNVGSINSYKELIPISIVILISRFIISFINEKILIK